MQMNLDFSPASMAMIGQHFQQAFVVLLGGIEIRVGQRAAIVIAPGIGYFGIFSRPPFQTAFLLGTWNALQTIRGIDAGFEMIG